MEIPNEIMKKIFKYQVFRPHPVALIFKQMLKEKIDEINKIKPYFYDYDIDDFDAAIDEPFAKYFFHGIYECDMCRSSCSIYLYSAMDYRYQNTLFEYELRHRRRMTLIELSDDED